MNNRVLARHYPVIPEGWRVVPISSALREVDRPVPMRDDESYRLVSVRRRNGGIFFRSPLRGSEILTKNLRWVVPGSFLLSRRQVVHGATSYVDDRFEGATVSKEYGSFLGTELCRAKYFSWLATQPFMYEHLLDSSHGVVIEKMTFDQGRWITLPIALPSLAEQDRIIDALDLMDSVVRNAEARLGKLRAIHRGLMSDLIPAVGLALNSAANPRGSILDDYVTWVSGGTPSKSVSENWNGDFPWLTPKDMKSRLVRATADTLTGEGVANGSRLAPESAVFIVVRGMILAHTFPVVRMQRASAFNQDVKALMPCGGVTPDYLSFWLASNSDYFLRLVTEATHGTKKLDLYDLKKVPVQFPDLADQLRAVEILHADERRIDVEVERVAKLKAELTGFAADLLLGRVRLVAAGDAA